MAQSAGASTSGPQPAARAPASALFAYLVSTAWYCREERGKIAKAMLIAAGLLALFLFLLNAKTVDFMFWKRQTVGALLLIAPALRF